MGKICDCECNLKMKENEDRVSRTCMALWIFICLSFISSLMAEKTFGGFPPQEKVISELTVASIALQITIILASQSIQAI